jgi:hypothetical protein
MTKRNLYKNIKTRKLFFNEEDYIHYMMLFKVLFRLEVIDEDCTLNAAMEFRPFFV